MRFHLAWSPRDKQTVDGEFTIGRRDGDVTFAGDDVMSGKHARFTVVDGRFYVTDLGSSNGTRVNRKKIPANVPVELAHHDEIKIGTTMFRVECEQEINPEHTHVEMASVEHTRLEHLTTEGTFIEKIGEGTLVEISLPNAQSANGANSASGANSAHGANSAPTPRAQLPVQADKSEATVTNLPPASSTVSLSVEEPTPSRRIFYPTESAPEPSSVIERYKENLHWAWSQKPLVLAVCVLVCFIAVHIFSGEKSVAKIDVAPESVEQEQPAAELAEAPGARGSPPPQPRMIAEEIKPLENTPVAAEAPVAEAPAEPLVEALPEKKPAPARRAVKKKNDTFSEAKLLARLAQLQSEYKRTKSTRVRAAIETDAIEVSTQHYHQLRLDVKRKWENGRNLASVKKNKLKETLSRALISINNREKRVRPRIVEYVAGKRRSPFP